MSKHSKSSSSASTFSNSLAALRNQKSEIVTISDHLLGSFEVYSDSVDRNKLIYKVGVVDKMNLLLPIWLGEEKIYLSPENLTLVLKKTEDLLRLVPAKADDSLKDETCKKIITLRLSGDMKE